MHTPKATLANHTIFNHHPTHTSPPKNNRSAQDAEAGADLVLLYFGVAVAGR